MKILLPAAIMLVLFPTTQLGSQMSTTSGHAGAWDYLTKPA